MQLGYATTFCVFRPRTLPLTDNWKVSRLRHDVAPPFSTPSIPLRISRVAGPGTTYTHYPFSTLSP